MNVRFCKRLCLSYRDVHNMHNLILLTKNSSFGIFALVFEYSKRNATELYFTKKNNLILFKQNEFFDFYFPKNLDKAVISCASFDGLGSFFRKYVCPCLAVFIVFI